MMKTSFKKIVYLMTLAIGLAAITSTVIAAEMAVDEEKVMIDSSHEFSANVAISTDYRFRGISQTTKDPAISGGFDYSYNPFGFYAGVWASNLDFGEPTTGPGSVNDTADMEIDFYGGFAGEFPMGVGWDIGGLYYYYPGSDPGSYANDYDYFEVYGSLSYDFGKFDVTGGLAYSPDYFAESGDAVYLYGDVGIPLPVAGLVLAGHVGNQWIDDNATFGTPDYLDWKIGLSKEISKFTFDISYIDTDLSDTDCFGGTDFCDATAVFTISASF